MLYISMLRKGSSGLTGTYENANHHAKPVIPLVDSLVQIIKAHGVKSDVTWLQGRNIHVLTRHNGDQLCLRPFYTNKVWGIEVLLKVSRKQEIPILQIFNQQDVAVFSLFFDKFLSLENNGYGKKDITQEN